MKNTSKIILIIIMSLILSPINNIVSAEEVESYNETETVTEDDTMETPEGLEGTQEIEEDLESDSSKNIIYIEIFCAVIGILMIIMANKTTN